MALNLKDLLKVRPEATIDTTIGALCLFSISVGGQQELLKSLNESIENTDPKEFLKKLIIFVCFPKDQLKNGEYKPDKPILTSDQVDQLSDGDLENIAKAYVFSNEYLFKKHEFKKRTEPDGKEVHYSVYSEIEYPQKSEEGFINYLHRLSCIEQDKQKERVSSILGSMPKLDSFSDALSGGIAKNLMFGNSIANSLKSIRAVQLSELTPEPGPLESIDWAEIERNKERVRRAPFDDLAQRLDELISTSVQASEFMIEANKIQTQIATEIKAGGDLTDRHAKNNIKLTIVVIFLTVVGVLGSGWSAMSGLSFSEDSERKIETYAINLADSIALSNADLSAGRAELMALQAEILNELKNLNETSRNSQSQMSEVYRIIEVLEESNREYERQIKELNYQFQEIKRSEN